ncbi:MAG: hypothetical protein ACHQ0J_07935 [Candidatus Dormibacterales bacterium]
MVQSPDETITMRARLAGIVTEIVEADPLIQRCRSISFLDHGGVQLAVELVPSIRPRSRRAIARELELTICRAVPALLWARVGID